MPTPTAAPACTDPHAGDRPRRKLADITPAKAAAVARRIVHEEAVPAVPVAAFGSSI